MWYRNKLKRSPAKRRVVDEFGAMPRCSPNHEAHSCGQSAQSRYSLRQLAASISQLGRNTDFWRSQLQAPHYTHMRETAHATRPFAEQTMTSRQMFSKIQRRWANGYVGEPCSSVWSWCFAQDITRLCNSVQLRISGKNPRIAAKTESVSNSKDGTCLRIFSQGQA